MYRFIRDISDNSSDTSSDMSRCMVVSVVVAKKKRIAIMAKAIIMATTVQARAKMMAPHWRLFLFREENIFHSIADRVIELEMRMQVGHFDVWAPRLLIENFELMIQI